MSKTILITGSSKGIGYALTEWLLEKGYRVVGIARTMPTLLLTQPNYTHYTIDLTTIEALEEKIKAIKKQHDIEVIICNAGIGSFKSLESFSVSELQQIMNTNFMSHAILCKAILPEMKYRKQGKIIFIGSEAALSGSKWGSIYCASKFALRGFAQSLRQECKQSHITISTIQPGMVDTNFYDSLSFQPGEAPENKIPRATIIDAIDFIMHTSPDCTVEEIVIHPLKKVIQNKK